MASPPCTIFHNPDLKWNIVQQCTMTTLPGCVSWPHPLSWYNIVSIAPYFQMDLNPQLVLRLASPVDFDLHQINPIFGNTNYAHFLPDSSAEYWIQNVNLLNCSQGCVGTINKFRKFSATFCHFHSSQVNNARFSWKFKNLKKATTNRSYLDRASGVNMMDFLCEGDRCLLRVERKNFWVENEQLSTSGGQ